MKRCTIVAALLASAVVSVSPAAAQTFYLVKVGLERGDAPVLIQEPSSGSRATSIGIVVSPQRSYCCEARLTAGGQANNTNDQASFGTLTTTGATPGGISVAARGFSEPVIPAFSGFAAPLDSRKCFIAPTADVYVLDVNVGADNSIQTTSSVECTETTLFGGYNTSVSQFNFLEISNTLIGSVDDAVTVRIDARNSVTGATVITGQQRVIPAGSRVDVDLHSIVGSGAFGPLTISHDGPPGAIRAAVAQYRVTGTSPPASVPVSREELTTRGRN